jgi:Transposase domain (DUF772)
MMGRRENGQGQLFYSFDLDEVVPADHLVRQIDDLLDLSWVHKELAPYYSHTGRPSIDPVLMIRMLLVGYVFAIRSERRICAELQFCNRIGRKADLARSMMGAEWVVCCLFAECWIWNVGFREYSRTGLSGREHGRRVVGSSRPFGP